MTFKAMGNEQILEVGAGFECVILFAADTAVGHLFVPFCATKTSERREGAAVGTAHDKLQVAVAYLRHGVALLALLYCPF